MFWGYLLWSNTNTTSTIESTASPLPTMTAHITARDVASTLATFAGVESPAGSIQTNQTTNRDMTVNLTAYPTTLAINATAAASATPTQNFDPFTDEDTKAGLNTWRSAGSISRPTSGAASRAMPLNLLNAVGIAGFWAGGWAYMPAVILAVVGQAHASGDFNVPLRRDGGATIAQWTTPTQGHPITKALDIRGATSVPAVVDRNVVEITTTVTGIACSHGIPQTYTRVLVLSNDSKTSVPLLNELGSNKSSYGDVSSKPSLLLVFLGLTASLLLEWRMTLFLTWVALLNVHLVNADINIPTQQTPPKWSIITDTLSAPHTVGIKDSIPFPTTLHRRDPNPEFISFSTRTIEPSSTPPSTLLHTITPSSSTSSSATSKTTSQATTTRYPQLDSTSAGASLDAPSLFQYLVMFAPRILEPWVALTGFLLLWPPGADAMMADARSEARSCRISGTVTVTKTVDAVQTVFVCDPQESTFGSPRVWDAARIIGWSLLKIMLYANPVVLAGFAGAIIMAGAMFGPKLTAEEVRGDLERDARKLSLKVKNLVLCFVLVATSGLAGATVVGEKVGMGMVTWRTSISTVPSMVTIYGRGPSPQTGADFTTVATPISGSGSYIPPPTTKPLSPTVTSLTIHVRGPPPPNSTTLTTGTASSTAISANLQKNNAGTNTNADSGSPDTVAAGGGGQLTGWTPASPTRPILHGRDPCTDTSALATESVEPKIFTAVRWTSTPLATTTAAIYNRGPSPNTLTTITTASSSSTLASTTPAAMTTSDMYGTLWHPGKLYASYYFIKRS
ncbi:Mucin-12 [Trapelia coarctata]|nr:Mucin-12 [Trapelia coarctata]